MPDDPDDLLAADYVLGALSAEERAQALAKSIRNPHFAAKITAWENRLAGLNDGYAPARAPNLLPQIEARIFGARSRRLAFLRNWSWLDGIFGQAALAAVSVLLIALMLQFSTGQVLTATLSAPGSDVQFSAHIEDGALTLQQIQGKAASAGHSYELWIILDGQAPKSLGLVGDGLALPAPSAPLGYVLAVTEEVAGGAPGGVPAGALVASGKFDKS